MHLVVTYRGPSLSTVLREVVEERKSLRGRHARRADEVGERTGTWPDDYGKWVHKSLLRSLAITCDHLRSLTITQWMPSLLVIANWEWQSVQHTREEPGHVGGDEERVWSWIEKLRARQNGHEVGQWRSERSHHVSLQARAAYHHRNQVQRYIERFLSLSFFLSIFLSFFLSF